MTRRLLAAAALLAVAGCTGSAGAGAARPAASSGAPSTARLVAAAGLDPCPPAAAGGASGLPDVGPLSCLGRGPAVDLHALTGAPTLVSLWASWCAPCQREVPYLQDVYAAAHGRLRVLGVDTEDDSRSALDFAAHVGMRYPSVVDRDGLVLHGLHAPGPPVTAFVDAEGRVRHVRIGEYRGVAELRADVARYLGVRL